MSRARSVADLGNQNVLDLNASAGTLKVGAGVTLENTGEAQFAGIITATGGDFSGNVSVGGVLTYEDVTSVDSVGVITARDGVHIVSAGASIYSPANNELALYTNSSERVRVESGGNIGIGTDNPNNLFHVYGGQIKAQSNPSDTSTNLDLIRAQCGPTGNALFSIRAADAADDNSNWDIKTNANEDLTFTIGSSTEKFRITSDGKIGINNNAPLYAMHFKNAMSSSPSFIHMEVTGTNAVGGGGGIAFDTSASNAQSNNGLYLATIAGIRNSADDGSNDLVFSTSKSNVNSNLPIERLRITSDGKIGIGNSTPVADLDLSLESSSVTLRVRANTNTGATPAIELCRGTNSTFGADTYGDYRIKGESGDLILEKGADSTTSEVLRTDGIRLLVGNTATANSGLLCVRGNASSNTGEGQITLQRGAGVTGADQELGSLNFGEGSANSAHVTAFTEANWSGSSRPTRLVFETAPSTSGSAVERMRIDSSGRVRIRPYEITMPTDGEMGTPVFIGLLGNTDPDFGAGAANQSVIRTMDCGSTNSSYTGYEIRNRQSGDLRFLNRDSGISNRANFHIYQDTDISGNMENTLSISYLAAFYATGVYDHATSGAANVNVVSGGQLRRSTSSIRFKTGVETLEDSYADALLNCRPVWYRSTAPGDNPAYGYWGFIAEEVAEIDPRLVQWSTETTEFVDAVDDDGNPLFEEDGTTQQKMRVKTTHSQPQPESVAYDRFVPHLINLIKRQKDTIDAMEVRLSALEGN